MRTVQNQNPDLSVCQVRAEKGTWDAISSVMGGKVFRFTGCLHHHPFLIFKLFELIQALPTGLLHLPGSLFRFSGSCRREWLCSLCNMLDHTCPGLWVTRLVVQAVLLQTPLPHGKGCIKGSTRFPITLSSHLWLPATFWKSYTHTHTLTHTPHTHSSCFSHWSM